jgi:hypothetical protein
MFEHLKDCFDLKDFTSDFLQLFKLYSHNTQGHIHEHINKSLQLLIF